jgi:hypothetical protein
VAARLHLQQKVAGERKLQFLQQFARHWGEELEAHAIGHHPLVRTVKLCYQTRLDLEMTSMAVLSWRTFWETIDLSSWSLLRLLHYPASIANYIVQQQYDQLLNLFSLRRPTINNHGSACKPA